MRLSPPADAADFDVFIAISVMSVAAVMGLTSNDVESSNSFPQILVTTRNQRLDFLGLVLEALRSMIHPSMTSV